MVPTDEEFLSIKDTYVAQVLERLRELARVEGEFLMRAAKTHPELSLPKISVELSKVINTTAAAIAAGVPSWPAEDRELAKQMIRDHLPKVLFEFAGDRVWTSLPASYQTWIIREPSCELDRVSRRHGLLRRLLGSGNRGSRAALHEERPREPRDRGEGARIDACG
jgi:hypothetical protein